MRILEIQALRAIAVILVLVFHSNLLSGGFIGVDIFYVISGYLITGLILKEIQRTGKFDFSEFYSRRIKRLLPSSFFVLIVTGIMSWLILPSTTRQELGRDITGASLYISNYLFAFRGDDYQNLGATPSPIIHYWSLAVEEQFYLVWPILIAWLSRFGIRWIKFGIVAITMASLSLSIMMTPLYPVLAFYSLPTRAWELGFGACLHFLSLPMLRSRKSFLLGVFGILLSVIFLNEDSRFPGYLALVPVLATALMIASIGSWPKKISNTSKSRVFQWIGEISYPLYLWHWPLLILPTISLGRDLRVYEICALIAVIFVLAEFTHRYIESPFRTMTISRRKVFAAIGVVTVALSSLGFAVSATTKNLLDIPGISRDQRSYEQITRKPEIYGSDNKCHLDLKETNIPRCVYGDKESDRTIILFGDSHAAQWFPALEKISRDHGLRLVSLTKSYCPSYDLAIKDDGYFQEDSCRTWRHRAIERMIREKPIAIFMSSLQYYKPKTRELTLDAWWMEGQIRTVAALKDSGAKLIAIGDTPHPKEDIPDCLALRDAEKCMTPSTPRRATISELTYIDPTSWLCSKACPPIIDGIVVYRDNSHLSVDTSLALSRKLGEKLRTFGILETGRG